MKNMVESTLIQTEKTFEVTYGDKTYSAVVTITENHSPHTVDIFDDEGALIDNESVKGILINNHIIEMYMDESGTRLRP